MSRYKLLYSLNLKEVLAYLNDDDYDSFNGYEALEYSGSIVEKHGATKYSLAYMIDKCFNSDVSDEHDSVYLQLPFYLFDENYPEWYLTDYGKEIIRMIINRYWDSYCINRIEDLDDLDYPVKKFMNKFINILTNTYDKYTAILDAYKDKKDALLDKINISGQSIVRFNDTPQDSGEFSDDEHTSNITQSSSLTGSDYKSPIERLEDIQRLYRNVLLTWTNEFKQLFWEEEQ